MIERSAKKCFVTIYTSRPGFVIGKKGSDVDKIKKSISKISSSAVSLNIKEVKKPELNAFLVDWANTGQSILPEGYTNLEKSTKIKLSEDDGSFAI